VAEVDPKLIFLALAAAMVAVALAFVLPFLRQRPQHAGAPVDGARARTPRRTIAAVALGLPLAAMALYGWLGNVDALSATRAGLSAELFGDGAAAPALPDAQAYAELERHLQREPGDARALVLKARLDMQAQRFHAAAETYARALAGPSKVALDAAVWVEYAEARGMLQGGRLAGEPQQLIGKALLLDALNAQALDLAGSAAWEQRDFATASRYWKRLLEQLAPGTARHAELSTAIERAEQRARVALPPLRP
jgi:cytochrome c-type biogenesis protein CcmH